MSNRLDGLNSVPRGCVRNIDINTSVVKYFPLLASVEFFFCSSSIYGLPLSDRVKTYGERTERHGVRIA